MSALTTALPVLVASLLAAPQAPEIKLLKGTFGDRLVPEGGNAAIPMRPSDGARLKSAAEADLIFQVETPQFRPPGAPGGLLVAFARAKDKGEGSLFIDTNFDGWLTDTERIPYTPLASYDAAREVQLDLAPAVAGGPPLPFRCRLLAERRGGEDRYVFYFTASFRVEGYVDIGGRRTLVSLPYDVARGNANVRLGRIGIDANGDGRIDLRGLIGPEVMFAKGDQVIMRVGDRYVSVESADFAARTFTLREHAAEEYTVIDVRVGAALPDFTFTDFDGRERKLSEFRGKHVLLDFWGSWCGPCVDELPSMKAAYDRFRDRGFEILGIDYEHGAPMSAVRKLLEEKGATWTNAAPDSVRDLVEKQFRIWAFPTFILIDPGGVIVEIDGPKLRGRTLITTLEKTLKQR